MPGKQKTLRLEGLTPLVARVEPYRPCSGLAVAPWRLDQVAGRFSGPVPSAPLLIVFQLDL